MKKNTNHNSPRGSLALLVCHRAWSRCRRTASKSHVYCTRVSVRVRFAEKTHSSFPLSITPSLTPEVIMKHDQITIMSTPTIVMVSDRLDDKLLTVMHIMQFSDASLALSAFFMSSSPFFVCDCELLASFLFGGFPPFLTRASLELPAIRGSDLGQDRCMELFGTQCFQSPHHSVVCTRCNGFWKAEMWLTPPM